MIFSLVAMIGLEKCCITSACLQWLLSLRWANRGPWASCFFFVFFCNSTYSLYPEHWIMQEPVYVLHLITCHGRIMPSLAELLFPTVKTQRPWSDCTDPHACTCWSRTLLDRCFLGMTLGFILFSFLQKVRTWYIYLVHRPRSNCADAH